MFLWHRAGCVHFGSFEIVGVGIQVWNGLFSTGRATSFPHPCAIWSNSA